MRVLFLPFFLLLSCNVKKNVFDEADYILVKSDSLNGEKGTEWFIYKYDTLRRLQVDYFGDGKLMAKVFTYGNNYDGKRTIYDFDGKTVIAMDSFSNGKKVLSWRANDPDTAVKMFSDGKLHPFIDLDSLK